MTFEVMCNDARETVGRSRFEYGFKALSGVGLPVVDRLRLRGLAERMPQNPSQPRRHDKDGNPLPAQPPPLREPLDLFEIGKRYKVEITELP